MAYHQHIAAAVTVAIGVWMLRNFLRVSAMSTNTPPVPTIVKSEQEWKQILSPEQYHVLRDKGTERPGTGALLKNKETGVYKCAGCGTELYKSETKFDSGCGSSLMNAILISNEECNILMDTVISINNE
eukprot:Rmarinus@m.438